MQGKKEKLMGNAIPEATGADIRPAMLKKEKCLRVTEYGASPDAGPLENTEAVNRAIREAAESGGGTVVFPAGTYYVYTILLQSNVNLFVEKGAVVAAAKPEPGGNYCEPEVNPYLGLQDHGHSYFANSLVYGADLENIMICGEGLFAGGRYDEKSGCTEYILESDDPDEPYRRDGNGHRGNWSGNKALAFVRCKNLVFLDFSVVFGGHFAILATGCRNMWVENIMIDTNRDAFDIDCCRNVTVRNSVFNSLTDDALCLKASFGAGVFMSLENVLIEDCVVSGYDAGSVYAMQYTREKLVAADRCGPTGRVKFGTESTCGYHLVTIRRVRFDRSRGFCMEAVDGSSLTDVIFEDCTMDHVSSSPIFIRAGDRGRFPVSGNHASMEYPAAEDSVRLDHPEWILPKQATFADYPAKRYTPAYNRSRTVTVDGKAFFQVLDEERPLRCNPANYEKRNDRYYLRAYEAGEVQGIREIPEAELPLYANAAGCGLARVENVLIRNVQVTDADPRYPVLLMGLTDSHLKNIVLENISVEYRGGLSMEHAVEQRQLDTLWRYSEFHAAEKEQSIPWLVNTFFAKSEALLPRADWNVRDGAWEDDPYNVPEMPDVYPEPSNWGILPAYGMYARHVDGLALRNLTFTCKVADGRHVCVLDDICGVSVDGLKADCAKDTAPIVTVTHCYRRHTNRENVPEQPYFTTEVSGLEILRPIALSDREISGEERGAVMNVEVNAPAPGTPADGRYPYPTVPCRDSGYRYASGNAYPLPLTVHRPFIRMPGYARLAVGEEYSVDIAAACPAGGSHEVYCEELPRGARFCPESGRFAWLPQEGQEGEYCVIFVLDDGVIPERSGLRLTVVSPLKADRSLTKGVL